VAADALLVIEDSLAALGVAGDDGLDGGVRDYGKRGQS
jgi:hypothetical protein